MRLKLIGSLTLVLAMLTPLLAGVFAPLVGASSHREAPLIANDPAADGTDFYMFVSPDKPDTVTFIANYIPLQPRYGGPNFHHPADEVLYSVKIDNNGDAEPDIVYQWRYRSERKPSALGGPAGDTYLYNDGSITSLQDANLLFRQYYTVYRIDVDNTKGQMWPDGTRGVRTTVAEGQVVPAFVGKESYCPTGSTFPPNAACTEAAAKTNYEAIAASAIKATSEGGQVFVGPRQESFYVDLSKTFDLARLGSLGYGTPTNDTAEFNVLSMALQVPTAKLLNKKNNDPVIGAWSTSARQNTEIIRANNVRVRTGQFVQVSRLGMPLVNEVVIGAKDKDKFNASEPKNDVANFGGYVVNPRLASILNALYGVAFAGPNKIKETGRGDLVQIFVTGIPGVNRSQTLTRGGEMLRLNTSIAPVVLDPANPTPNNDKGVLAANITGDLAGFPNGRRVTDDVVDIELTAVQWSTCTGPDEGFGATVPCTGLFHPAWLGGGTLGDGVDRSGLTFLTSFPYLPTPHSATEAD